MTAKRNWILLALAAVMALPAVVSAQGKIAVANTARIFNEMQETKDLREKVRDDQQKLLDTERQKQQQIRALQEARDQLKPDSPEYQNRNEEVVRATIEYRIWGETMQQNLLRQQKQQVTQLFEKIERATADVAKQRGVDLVLAEQRSDIPQDQDKMTTEQFTALMAQRNVLHAADSVNLTNDILTMLDQRYKSGQ